MTAAARTDTYRLDHVLIEVKDAPTGRTFALFAGEALTPAERGRALFTGHVKPGMASELRRLAARLDEIEDDMRARDARRAAKMGVSQEALR